MAEAFACRPSTLIGMADGGYSATEQLAFDSTAYSFATEFRRERDAIRYEWEKPEKAPHKGLIRVPKPKHDRDWLLRKLNIDPKDVDESRELQQLAESAGVDPSSWDSLPDYPEEP